MAQWLENADIGQEGVDAAFKHFPTSKNEVTWYHVGPFGWIEPVVLDPPLKV